MRINKTGIVPFNNSYLYGYYQNAESDSLPAKAIGFKVHLFDSTMIEYCEHCSDFLYNELLGFKGAYAFEPCDRYNFILKNKLKEVHVETLFRFDEDLPKGSEIDSLLVYNSHALNLDEQIYFSASQLIEFFNAKEELYEPEVAFEIYLKRVPMHDSLQLRLEYHFEDKTILVDTTKVIFPVN